MEALESAIVRACGERDSPEGKIAAGVHAAFDYAAANPGPTQALIARARAGETPWPCSSVGIDPALLASIAAVINGHLCRGETEGLAEAAADMTELSLLPYVGFGGARRTSHRSM